MTRRSEALAAVDGRCPRCGASRERDQEYCVECGLRLPSLRGSIPALRRRWIRGLAWYPGDWVWVSLLTLLVAAAGAAVAVAFGRGPHTAGATTSVAPTPRRITTAGSVTPLPTAPEPGATAQGKTTPSSTTAANGRMGWPARRNGWTIVLFSYPLPSGTTAPYSLATRAAHAGLPEVGVLDSGQFASLHPGYYIVFSGVYSTASEAEAALRSVRASGFGSAYTRQISR